MWIGIWNFTTKEFKKIELDFYNMVDHNNKDVDSKEEEKASELGKTPSADNQNGNNDSDMFITNFSWAHNNDSILLGCTNGDAYIVDVCHILQTNEQSIKASEHFLDEKEMLGISRIHSKRTNVGEIRFVAWTQYDIYCIIASQKRIIVASHMGNVLKILVSFI